MGKGEGRNKKPILELCLGNGISPASKGFEERSRRGAKGEKSTPPPPPPRTERE